MSLLDELTETDGERQDCQQERDMILIVALWDIHLKEYTEDWTQTTG